MQTLTCKAPAYLGDTLTAEIEVLSLKPDKPVCQLKATITNQDGTLLLDGECWTYTMRPARGCRWEPGALRGAWRGRGAAGQSREPRARCPAAPSRGAAASRRLPARGG